MIKSSVIPSHEEQVDIVMNGWELPEWFELQKVPSTMVSRLYNYNIDLKSK